MSKTNKKVKRHLAVKVRPVAMRKAAPKRGKAHVTKITFVAHKKKASILHRGWKIYTDHRGYFVGGRYIYIRGKRVRRVISGKILAVIKARIDKLYAAGAKDW